MNLAFKLSGTDAVVYRKPWGVIVYTIAMGTICCATATPFFLVGYHDYGTTIGVPFLIFGTIFATAGLSMLAGVSRKAHVWLREGGVPLMNARKSGLTIQINVASKPQSYSWSAINSIILAGSLEVVEKDETHWSQGQLILILNPHAEPKSILGQIKAQIARSGEGKVYLATSFQNSSARELESALRRLAPASVVIKRAKIATFDKVKKTDTYTNI